MSLQTPTPAQTGSSALANEGRPRQALAGDGVIRMSDMLSLLMSAGAGPAFGVKGLDGCYQLANAAMARLLDLGGDGLTGKSENDLLPAPQLEQVLSCDQSIIAGEEAASVEIDLPVNGQSRRHLWVKLPVVGADHRLQSLASIIFELPLAAVSGALEESTLDHLQKANRELRQAVIALEEAAGTDKLTGTWNRRRLEECVIVEMDRLNRYEHPLSMLIIDIDFFKAVNDQNGHKTGDQVLQTLAALLRAKLRATDTLARWGGEEFVVLCPNSRRTTAATLAERLRQEIAKATFPVVGLLTVSIGVAECAPRESWQQWFERADEALYRAKRSGRNQVQLAPDVAKSNGVAEYVVANFVQLVWRSAYESGDERVDSGHRQLFADANDLLSAILSDQTSNGVGKIVERLISDVMQHFHDEEAIIAAAGFPDTAAHIVLHRELVDRALQLLGKYRAGKQGVGDIFQFLAYDVITKHMLSADRQFFQHLQTPSPVGRTDGLVTDRPMGVSRSTQARPGDRP